MSCELKQPVLHQYLTSSLRTRQLSRSDQDERGDQFPSFKTVFLFKQFPVSCYEVSNSVVNNVYLFRDYLIDAGQEIGLIIGHGHDCCCLPAQIRQNCLIY